LDDQPSLLHSSETDVDEPSLRQAQAQAAVLAEQRDTALLSLGVERLERLRLRAEAADLRNQLAAMRAEVDIGREEARQRSEDAVRLQQKVEEIRTSTAWRLMGPWRLLGRAVRDPGRTLRFVTGRTSPAPPEALDAAPVVPVAPAVDERAAFLSVHESVPIYFPRVEEPVVSVVVPCFKALEELEVCLRSLVVTLATEPSFEVILVDDGPDLPVVPSIPESPGLTRLGNSTNLGFLHTCNRGAAQARGRFLCFLNTDTIARSGWLRALVEALEEVPDAGIAGGMLLGCDGRIQEAGWAILNDGWGAPVGRDADPNDGAYSYRRRVDCVTGACFLIGRETFNDLGGFDTLYAPAFYEEFDLAFRVMARGRQVIYEPRSRVVHLGSTSYGVTRRDQLSIINHEKFVARFADVLSRRLDDGSDDFALRGTPGCGPVVLVAEDHLPLPDQSAGDVTISRYLMLLATSGWRVVFGSLDGTADGPAAAALERCGIELIRRPDTVERWLERHGRHVRHVLLARPHVAEALLGAVRANTSASVAYYTHDLHHVRLQREASILKDAAREAEALLVKDREVKVFAAVDCITSPSEAEAKVIRDLAPGADVSVIPPFFYDEPEVCAYEPAHFAPLRDVVFVGGFAHVPNVDAAQLIATEIMPIVWRSCPDAHLILVGHAPPASVQALAGPLVTVTGSVPMVEPYLDRARVFLAALRFGAGVKGKTVQAMQRGVPVVTTSVGAEGIGIDPDRDAIVADGVEALAQSVVLLLRDPDRCAALSNAGANVVRQHFSRTAARQAVNQVFHSPRCAVCGSGRILVPPYEPVCGDCLAARPIEGLAQIVCRRLAKGGETSLAELARSGGGIKVHLHGAGPIVETIKAWVAFSHGHSRAPTATDRSMDNGPFEMLERLAQRDRTFDIFITQGALDFRSDLWPAVSEIYRVTRPGGAWIFSDTSEVVRDTALAMGFTVVSHDVSIPGGGGSTRIGVASRPLDVGSQGAR
jgi:GT2 family glycosyltransferase/glycosyltransferase involved in cell wall biosynthesis